MLKTAFTLLLCFTWATDAHFELLHAVKDPSPQIEYSSPFRVMHPELRSSVTSVLYRDKIFPVYHQVQETGAIREEILTSLLNQNLGQSLLQFFQSREPSSELEFEWILAPKYDYYLRRIDFALLLRKQSQPLWLYARTIRLLENGYAISEVDQPWHPALQDYLSRIETNILLTQSEETGATARSGMQSPARLFRELILPPNPEGVSFEVETGDSFVERHRKSIGGIFLLVSILFFLFAPRLKS